MIESPHSVVLVSDQTLLLESLVPLIENEPGLAMAGTATDIDEGIQLVLSTNAKIAIFDIEHSQEDPFGKLSRLRRRNMSTRIILLSSRFPASWIKQALGIDVHGILTKKEPVANFLMSITKVILGEYCFSEEVDEMLDFVPKTKRYILHPKTGISCLTPRQLEVLRYLAEGKSVKETAHAMHITPKSVDNHKYRIMHRLDVHDRVQLARLSIREGFSVL